MDSKILNEKGFGIVELVVSMVILAVGITSIMTLMSRIVLAGMRSEAAVISLNLAREGVEVIRNIRDSNWVAGRVWDDSLYQGMDYTAVAIFDPLRLEWSLSYLGDTITDEESTRLYYDKVHGLYTHDDQFFKTPYKRLITVNPICHDSAYVEIIRSSGSDCLPTETKVGVEVTSHVQWDGTKNIQNTILVDKIYNWR